MERSCKVGIITTKNCIHCMRLKKLLKAENIEFDEFDVYDNLEEYKKFAKLTKSEDVPLILVDKQILVPKISFNTLEEALEIIKDLVKS